MKILMIHTGGTISCVYENGVLSPKGSIAPVIDKMFKNERDVRLFHKTLPPILSENTDGRVLNKIISAAAKGILSEKYDGVIVTLGSDALAYISAAVSYAVGLSKTPCITVCSDRPLSSEGASGILNLRAAIAVIRSKKAAGTLTVYPFNGGRVSVYRASRIMQQAVYSCTPGAVGEPYGTVENGEFIKNIRYTEAPDAFTLKKPSFTTLSPVMLLSVYPGMVYPAPPRRVKVILLGSYHSGTVNTESSETLKLSRICKRRGITVYVGGISGGTDYESMTKYDLLGFKRLPPLSSPEAMLIKLWLLLGEGRDSGTERLSLSLGGDLG